MASRLNLDEVVNRLFNDGFGLSEDESSEEEGDEDSSSIYAFTGLCTVDPEELTALGSFVTSHERSESEDTNSEKENEPPEEFSGKIWNVSFAELNL